MEANSKILYGRYAKTEVELQKIKQENSHINDERIALNVRLSANGCLTIRVFQTTVTMLTEQTINMEKDRIHFLNKIRELNEQRIDLLNAEVALDEKYVFGCYFINKNFHTLGEEIWRSRNRFRVQ